MYSVFVENAFEMFVSEGFQEDWQIEIYGTPKILPQSFSVSLNNENNFWPSGTIPLKITANFGKLMETLKKY